MYKVIVTADGTTATASKHCHSMAEANAVKNKLGKWLKMPVKIEIVRIGGDR